MTANFRQRRMAGALPAMGRTAPTARFDLLLDHFPGEAWVYERDLSALVYANPTACSEHGLPLDGMLGRETLGHVAPTDRETVTRLARQALDKGQRTSPHVIAQIRPDHSQYSAEVVLSPLEPAHIVVWGRNISDHLQETRDRALRLKLEQDARQRAEAEKERLSFISEASRQLATSLDYLSTLACVARLAVPRMATWCILDIVLDDDTLQREAVAHQEPFKVLLACELQQHGAPPPGASTAIASVLAHGRPRVLTGEEIEAVAFAHDARSRELSHNLGMQSCLLIPLRARGRTVGCLTLVSSERMFGPRDLETAEALGRHAGLALDNAVLYRDCSAVAQTLERSLMLPQLPRLSGVDLALHYQPAHGENSVGGDFYDVCENIDGRWSVVLGDVRGKGIPAATLTALARYTLRAAALQGREPSQALALLNQALVRQDSNRRSCTAVYALFETSLAGFRVKIASGGHPLPLVLRSDGSVHEAGRSGRLMGLYGQLDLEDDVVLLAPGDAMLFFTDGLSEARQNGETFEDQVPAILAECPGKDAQFIVETLERRVRDWQDSLHDDMALLVVRVRVPGEKTSPHRTRRRKRE